MNLPPADKPDMGTTTRAIEQLLPAVRRGDIKAINDVIAIAHDRLIQLIQGKRLSFAPGIAKRYYRGDEQTGHILSELYERLRKAVDSQRLSKLEHPAGFWKIAADHVRFILLDETRKRKLERRRAEGPCSATSDSSGNPIDQLLDQRYEDARSPLLRMEILDAIGKLPEPHQTILELYYYLGATQREISDILLPDQPDMYERKVGRIIDQAERMLGPLLSDYEHD